jgi:putative SOS response-associated peptidase YedK
MKPFSFSLTDIGRMYFAYRLTHSKQYLAERFEVWDEIEVHPRYHIAPTQPVVTVRREMGKKLASSQPCAGDSFPPGRKT